MLLPSACWAHSASKMATFRERKMRTNFFCTNSLNTPKGPGHPSKIPGTSQIPLFETQGRQSFEGEHEVFDHHPFPWKTPTPLGGLRNQKVNLCSLFSCLNFGLVFSTSLCTLHSVSELRRACFRQVRVTQAALPPRALFHTEAFALPPRAPSSHIPHLGLQQPFLRCPNRFEIAIAAISLKSRFQIAERSARSQPNRF